MTTPGMVRVGDDRGLVKAFEGWSSCDWTVLKPGMMFGRGDHILDRSIR